jgi:hypothetical protein
MLMLRGKLRKLRGRIVMQGWKVALGAASCGVVVGWLLYTFVKGSKDLNFKVLSGLITIAVGTAAMAVFRGADALSEDFMFYFVGMALAIMVLGTNDVAAGGSQPPNSN